jgi:hypothetical protein
VCVREREKERERVCVCACVWWWCGGGLNHLGVAHTNIIGHVVFNVGAWCVGIGGTTTAAAIAAANTSQSE